MDRQEFSIQGSAEEPYHIVFTRAGGLVVGVCSCPAGENGQWCKHRLGILREDPAICAGLDPVAIAAVRSWLPGTLLERVIAEVAAAEAELEKAQAVVKKAKKRLSAALFGRE